jgi:hypothetical protein
MEPHAESCSSVLSAFDRELNLYARSNSPVDFLRITKGNQVHHTPQSFHLCIVRDTANSSVGRSWICCLAVYSFGKIYWTHFATLAPRINYSCHGFARTNILAEAKGNVGWFPLNILEGRGDAGGGLVACGAGLVCLRFYAWHGWVSCPNQRRSRLTQMPQTSC